MSREIVAPVPVARSAPKLRWRWSAADTVVASATGLIAIIVAVFAFLCWQGFGTTVSQADARVQTAAGIVASDVEWAIDAAFSYLTLAGDTPGDPAIRARTEAAVKTLPAGAVFGLYDADGQQEAGNPGTLPASIGTSDFFAALKGGAQTAIGRQMKDAATGAPLIVVARRLGGTRFGGVAVVAFPGDLLRMFWEPQKLGTDSNVNIHRDDGWMVGRYPPLAEPIDATKVSSSWAMISSTENGSYVARSPLDGVQRIVGFRHIRDLGLVVFATISLDAVLANLWNSIFIVSALLAPIALALFFGALLTAKLLRDSAKTQARLAAAVAQNEVLFREIHHRVKNNLQSVASLLQMQPIPREIKADMGQRIAAMSAVHEHIYRSNDFAQVRVKEYLTTLVENIRAGADPKVTVVTSLEDLAVDKDAATPLGLILNEVVANAFKHAFSDGREGRISVQLAHRGEEAQLTVEDNGVGFDPDLPAKGIGRRLIKALTAQLGGESGFSNTAGGGSRFVLTFPMAKLADAT